MEMFTPLSPDPLTVKTNTPVVELLCYFTCDVDTDYTDELDGVAVVSYVAAATETVVVVGIVAVGKGWAHDCADRVTDAVAAATANAAAAVSAVAWKR